MSLSQLSTAVLIALAGVASAVTPPTDPFLSAARVAALPHTSIATDSGGLVTQTSGYSPIENYPPVEGYPSLAVEPVGYCQPSAGACWEVLPDGLIYRSYLAGPRESRLGLHTHHVESSVENSTWFWDATLGGRKGLLRYGNNDPVNPIGWQLDIEGATVVRLNLDEARDVDASDFRFGVPLTYTAGDGVSYKMGYYHVSSHLGDELILRQGMNTRINYVRDALIAGVSYQWSPYLRVYGETAWAFFTAGGAEPWEFQFGAEWSRPGPTGFAGTPFLATNAHLRQENDFGGDWTLQTGWLWRGDTGSMMRLGLHYMNGKSTQYQFFNRNEEQIGFGIWYDF